MASARGLPRIARAAWGLAALAGVWTAAAASPAAADDGGGGSAVVVVYHRFDEPEHPTASISTARFEAHLAELAKPRYTVLPLPEIVARLRGGEKLPDRAVGIAIDGAFLSAYEKAWPRLRDAGLPFALFVTTDPVDYSGRRHMSWDHIRELRDAGAAIGSRTKSHPRLPAVTLAEARREIEHSNARFVAELGARPTLFAYPYGEYNLPARDLVAQSGFEAAFGMHSGVVHPRLDRFQLPRFPLNERYGGIDRFRLVADALPLPVTDLLPADPALARNPPSFGFTVVPELGRLDRLACFASARGEMDLEKLGRRVEARFRAPLPPGRSRLNCTMPGPDGRWRWFGLQFLAPP